MNDYRSVVVRITPRLRWILLLLVTLALVSQLAAYFIGRSQGQSLAELAIVDNQSLRQEIVALEQALQSQRQRAVRAEKTAEIDRLAVEGVHQTLLNYHREAAELRSDVDFYRSLIAPEELERGLNLYSFKLSFDTDTGLYRYRALVTQAGAQNLVIKGKLSITLTLAQQPAGYTVGEGIEGVPGQSSGQEQKEQVFSLAEMPAFDGQLPAKLRFRFFQKVEGAFKLPDGQRPVSMEVEVKSTGKSAHHIQQHFTWQQLAETF